MAAAAAASASYSSDVTVEGPVLSVINKRIRALRKKLNRIAQMEESLAQGKILNKEQEETLRSKPTVLAGIDELEKIRQPLSQALDNEIQLAIEKNRKSEACGEEKSGVRVSEEAEERDGVSDLLNLLYFGTVFDVKTLMGAHDNVFTRTHERNSCLTYDYVTDDDSAGDPLKEWDLDLISTLGGLMISRPGNSSSSHKDALKKCVEHAKLWLSNSVQPIEPNSNVTYVYLREKLNKILASEYLTTTPEIKASVEMAAAAGNYSSFQAPLHGSVIPSAAVVVSVEGSHEEYPQQGEQPTNFYSELYEEQNRSVRELHQGASHEENTSEVRLQTEPATGNAKTDQNRDVGYEEQQQPSRRQPQYQDYRGRGSRGRRPYASGGRGWRGGGNRGGYQNGHSQYYEQPFGYYPRNSHFRGRGGRGLPPGHYTHVEAES